MQPSRRSRCHLNVVLEESIINSEGGGWGGVCGPLPKTLTLLMTAFSQPDLVKGVYCWLNEGVENMRKARREGGGMVK